MANETDVGYDAGYNIGCKSVARGGRWCADVDEHGRWLACGFARRATESYYGRMMRATKYFAAYKRGYEHAEKEFEAKQE